MKCPLDGSELRMTERQGIEIDYCPQCRGVWLDRGELDKLLETSRRSQPDIYAGEPRDERSDRPPGQQYPHKRKESFWERIFDFD